MTRKPSSLARTAAAYQNCGCATSTTIAATTQTSQRTCAGSVTARPAGRGARDGPTIGAYPNGCSATAKTIVATVRTSCPKIVRRASPRTISVRTIGAYRRDGCAISRTTVATIRTSRRTCAKGCTASVRNPSSSVPTASVYRASGDATTTTIAVTTRTSSTVEDSSARTAHSSARAVTASRRTSDVTETGTAETSAMKSAVLRGSPKVGIVLSPNSSARPPNCVCSILKSVTARTIAVMVQTKRPNFAVSLNNFNLCRCCTCYNLCFAIMRFLFSQPI